MSNKETDFPTGLHPDEEKIKPKTSIKMSSRALMYYLGRYSHKHEKESWYYTYFNSLPTDGRTQEQIGKKLGYSRRTITDAFKELEEVGFLKKYKDHYRLYENYTIWRAIPNIKLDAVLEYVKRHKGETWLVETYVALIAFSRSKREASINQILQLFGHANTKESNYVKIIDAIDHLNSNDYCKIIKRKVVAHDGWESYYVYMIVDEMKKVKPTYCERLNGGEKMSEQDLLEIGGEAIKAMKENEDEAE